MPIYSYNQLSDVGDFFGYGLNLGLQLNLSENLVAGFSGLLFNSIHATRDLEAVLGNEVVSSSNEPYEYTLNNPYQLSGGLSYRFRPFQVEVDMIYTAWSQADYHQSDFTSPISTTGLENTLDYAIGAEMEIPVPYHKMPSAVIRGGYQYGHLAASADDPRHILSTGLGLLFDRSLLLEVAFSHAMVSTSDIDETDLRYVQDVKTDNLIFSISYRY